MFIVFEGVDGAGKSTALKKSFDWLSGFRDDVLKTREIGGTKVSEMLRKIILSEPMDPITENLVIAAARAEHIEEVISVKRKDHILLSDRYFPSSYAYNGYGRNHLQICSDVHTLLQEHCSTYYPDYMLFFSITYEKMLERMQIRAGGATDRFEAEKADFFKRVFDGYQQVIKDAAYPVYVIDAMVSEEEVFQQVQEFFKIKVLE